MGNSKVTSSICCVFAVLTALILGCSREKAPGVYITDSRKTIAEMSSRDIIFKVNGHAVRKRDFLRCQQLQAAIYAKVNSTPSKSVSKRDIDNYVLANEQKLLPMLMQRELFSQAAVSAGVVVSDAEIDEMAKTLLKAYGLKSRTVAEVRRELDGDEGAFLVETIAAEALSQKGIRTLAEKGRLVVSAQDVSNHLERVRAFNETADKMNKRAREMLLKAKSEILAGAKFGAVAKKYAEVNPEEGMEWRTVEIPELVSEGEAQLKRWLATAKVGDISDPMDFDDGISIVGLVRKGLGEVPANMEPPMLYTLVRCTMYARQSMETPSEDEARALLAEFRLGEAQKEIGAAFYNKSVIEFPNGTNFFGRVQGH